MNEYNLKDKIIVNDEFLTDLIAKSWHEADAIQQQINNIDTSTKLGIEVAALLKSLCTSYYVLTGCLENLSDATPDEPLVINTNAITVDTLPDEPIQDEPKIANTDPEFYDDFLTGTIPVAKHEKDFEPFEYFVDFDEPTGAPLSDEDLYGKK